MKRNLLYFLLLLSIILQSCSLALALEKPTHRYINGFIAKNNMNGFFLDSYLKDHLGLTNGVEEDVKDGRKIKKVFEWLMAGAKDEDNPVARSFKHFHNPLEPNLWDAGLWGGESAVLWAQNPIGFQSTQGMDYSWHDTRDYFYNALTSQFGEERQEYFAKTFEGIGHLMHLVTDMSVPEHVRNDAHPLGTISFGLVSHYEQWIKDRIRKVDDVGSYSPIFFDSTYLKNPSAFTEAPIPIANLFDTNQYEMGDHPYVTVNNPTIGLSEYTNANFLSPGTMFTDEFPYPSLDHCTVEPDLDLNRYYVQKDFGVTGERIDHLAVVSYLYFWRYRYFPNERMNCPVGLDGRCYEEYASHLIPRAVGYSANLLEYFFRGEIDIVLEEGSILDHVIENKTEEEMEGTFEIYYDNTTDQRIKIWDKYMILGTLSSGNNKSDIIDFDEPQDAKVPGKYMVVFRGKLGNETDAVTGKEAFFPGIIEEWDNGLTGKYPWVHQLSESEPNNGEGANDVVDGVLIKDNIKHTGYSTPRANDSILYVTDADHPEGMLISANTRLEFKIDDMSINQGPEPLQILSLNFNNGLRLHFTQNNQDKSKTWWDQFGGQTVQYVFELDTAFSESIYALFQNEGIQITEPLYLEEIYFAQQIFGDTSSSLEYRQHMEVDYLRIKNEDIPDE